MARKQKKSGPVPLIPTMVEFTPWHDARAVTRTNQEKGGLGGR